MNEFPPKYIKSVDCMGKAAKKSFLADIKKDRKRFAVLVLRCLAWRYSDDKAHRLSFETASFKGFASSKATIIKGLREAVAEGLVVENNNHNGINWYDTYQLTEKGAEWARINAP